MIGRWQKDRWRKNIWLRGGLFALVNAAALSGLLCLFAWPIQAFFADRNAQISQQRAILARLNSTALFPSNGSLWGHRRIIKFMRSRSTAP